MSVIISIDGSRGGQTFITVSEGFAQKSAQFAGDFASLSLSELSHSLAPFLTRSLRSPYATEIWVDLRGAGGVQETEFRRTLLTALFRVDADLALEHEVSAKSSIPRTPSGIDGLDSMLAGGFPQGKVVLILGEPGTGKTILCSQFLHRGATEGEDRGIFIGMNEPKTRLMTEMRDLGMDFEGLEKTGKFGYVDGSEVRRIPEQAKVGRIPVGGRELGLANLIDLMEEGITRISPNRIVLDSISDLVFRFPKIEDRRPAILDIVEALQATGATCLLTSELLSTGESRKLQPEEYLAEGVIILKVVKKGVRTIQISKMRGAKIDAAPRPFVIRDSGIEVLAREEVYA